MAGKSASNGAPRARRAVGVAPCAEMGCDQIEMPLQVMEDHRDDLVVIPVGYGDRMDTFFRSDPGFHSRSASARSLRDAADIGQSRVFRAE